MRRYKIFCGLAVFFFVLFIFWHLFTLRTMPKDMSFIGPMLVTVAWDSLHGFLYLAMELLMLLLAIAQRLSKSKPLLFCLPAFVYVPTTAG